MQVMDILSRTAFGIASVALMLMAVVLVAYGVWDLVLALKGSWREAGDALLTAIGYQVIAMAVFDVAKYFIEEEVIRRRHLYRARPWRLSTAQR